MFFLRSTLVSFILTLLSSGIAVAGRVTSGPQSGEKAPGPFKVLNITGSEAGQTSCQYCDHGARPVAVIFTKAITPEVAQLITKIETVATMINEAPWADSSSCAAMPPGSISKCGPLPGSWGIQSTILTIYNKTAGPDKYGLSAEADVTVLLYKHLTVKANHAFKNAELTEAAASAILADLAKMLSEN